MNGFARTTLALGAVLSLTQALAATRGGELRYGRYADSLFLDPVLNDANLDIWILTNLYDTLLQPTNDGKGVQPGLASAYTVAADGKSMRLTLRPNLKFADGSALTAQDVKWSLDRARKPDNGAWSGSLESIDTITASGNTVTLNLKRPDPTLPAALATFNTGIMPQKLFTAAPGSNDAAKAKAFAEKPVGSGPFVLSEWKKGSSMVLKRNPHYWKKGEDGKALPYLDSIRFEIIPDDNTRILKLQAGELDGAEFIPLSRVNELKANPNINMQLFPSTKVNSVLMNNRPKLKDGTANPLSDVRVRQALNYATNKEALVQIVTFGTGKPMKSFMSTTTPLYAAQTGYPYDLNKAKQLLTAAGFPNGFEVTSMATSGSADDLALLTALQQMWAAAGVRLKIEQLDAATKTARYRAADFQMRTAAWTNDINDPSQITRYFAIFDNIESLYTGFKSPEIDKLFAQSQQETNRTKRADQYKQIQSIYMNAAPIVFLYETPYPVALSKNVKGFVQIPLGNNIFASTYLEK
ncbi:ABC transporter substrate-binding protein [Deinococcus peraridilitoris]|uniref:ABC-type dipeptide transport system, periplasmic component n=1 Tax=Deinococcus peraridilitoris (strain DSM 19664 / LMG 22246 / CIP 109416 / KR-200) TaxID=937777 RepID=L0A975_DEIPD|nr:ABC transporter substrate-binding protein [Deinococcus peraridilitoris]AFZ69677.1 ABC-type dipeptide transport system, periplasmic component [Deinococcus peraridilitoris DSM 19664]